METRAPPTARPRTHGGDRKLRPVTLPVGQLRDIHESYFDAQACRFEAGESAKELAIRLTYALSRREEDIDCNFLARRISALLDEAAEHERCVQRLFCAAMDGPEPERVS